MISKVFRAPKRIYKLATLASFNFSTAKKGGSLNLPSSPIQSLLMLQETFSLGVINLLGLATSQETTFKTMRHLEESTCSTMKSKRWSWVQSTLLSLLVPEYQRSDYLTLLIANGELFTFGFGKALGHGRGNETLYTPKKVDFFSSKGLRVKDVAVGEDHTIAVTG